VDLIDVNHNGPNASARAILSITDDTRTFTRLAVLTDDKIDSVATTIWHLWCQPYGNPETIRSNRGKVWTSKLESRINNLGLLEPKITCQSEKENFNPEIRQHWQQSRLDTSAEEFAQAWNFLCNLQAPDNADSGIDRLSRVDQDLDDIEDFVADDVGLEDHRLEELERKILVRMKQVSLCRHKLQTRAYPKSTEVRKVWRPSEQRLEPENPDLDHEWLQLIQLERAINRQKKLLLETEVGDHGDPEKDYEPFSENGESLDRQSDHLDDEDLEYVNNILNSFSRPIRNHEGSNNLKLKNVTQKDALAPAFASRKTPQEFNLNFNQKSTTRGSEEDNFSYFSKVEEDRAFELGDYFSDNEEDDIWNRESLTSESNFWSHTKFQDPEENLPLSQPALSGWDPVISGLETIHEAKFGNDGQANKLNHISGLSEDTRLSFATWQPFIPLEHTFQNCAAQSQPSDFLSSASFLQELTLARISTISTPTKRTSSPKEPISPPLRISFTKKSLQTEFPDHPEPPKQYKRWKQQSQSLTKTSQNQNTRFQNMPQATDAGSEPQVYIQLKSPSYSTMKSKGNTTAIKSWETEWPKFSNKTPTYQTKLQKNTKPHRRNSKRIQLWPWSQKQYPPTCSLDTAKTVKKNQNKKMYLHGEIHSSTSKTIRQNTSIKPEWPDHQNQAHQPRRRQLLNGSYGSWRHHHSRFKQFARWKRRSTFSQTRTRKISKLKSKKAPTTRELSPKRRSESESYDRYKRLKSKNDIKSEHEYIEVRNRRQLKTLLETTKAKVTAKADKVKAIGKTLEEFRVRKEKQVDKKIEAESSVTLPPHFAITYNISILTFTIFIFSFNIFISILNPFVSDHHCQTFTIGDLSDCRVPRLSRLTMSAQAKATVNALANPDSIRLFEVPETQPDPRYKNLPRKFLVPKHLLAGKIRKSENALYNDSFRFNYLEFSR
jgi:hypothetical protein